MLKRRGDDELTADLRDRLYWAKLKHLPRAAIAYIADKGLERWTWFPTISECLELAKEWQPMTSEIERAHAHCGRLVEREARARLDDARRASRSGSMTQSDIDALPNKVRSILATEGHLWRWPDGRFTLRVSAELFAAMSEDEKEQVRALTIAMFAEWDRMEQGEAA